MYIQRRGFQPIILDNEEAYFNLLEAILNSIDEYCSCEITATLLGYMIRVAPSAPDYLPSLLKSIKEFNTTLGIQVEFSKSMVTSANIVFILNNKK